MGIGHIPEAHRHDLDALRSVVRIRSLPSLTPASETHVFQGSAQESSTGIRSVLGYTHEFNKTM